MALMVAGQGARLQRGRGRSVHRAAPVAAAMTAIALTVAVFPDALHSSVAGPGPQGAVQPHAQASVTHEGDVPPLNLGQSGAGAEGSGAGTGRPSAVQFGGRSGGFGAGSNPGFGAGAGAGPGIGSGSGSGPGAGTGSSSPTHTPSPSGSPTPGPPSPSASPSPSPTSCPSCQGRQGTPAIPYCYSNSLGPDSQTTEDPLSPPCASWNGRDNGGATSQGVSSDRIDVVLLRSDGPAPSDAYLNGAATPDSDVCQPKDLTCTDQTWRVLRQFFQSHYQTYGRTVVLHGYTPTSTTPAAIAQEVSALHPFAVVDYGYDQTDPYFARYGIESFGMSVPSYDADMDAVTLQQDSPYLWRVLPSMRKVIADGASWVCNSIVGNPLSPDPPTRSNDPSIQAMPHRKIALGYTTVSGGYLGLAATYTSKQLADAIAAAVDHTCGNGSAVFATFGDSEDIRIYDNSNKGSGDPSVATNALAQMKQQGVTSILCVWCGYLSNPVWSNLGSPGFDQAEEQAQYFPEFLFLSGQFADPVIAREANQVTFNNAFGLSELWQLPGYTQTYWQRAFMATDPTVQISQTNGMSAYETLMQLYGAIQLAGASLTSTNVEQGMYHWTRSFGTTVNTNLPPTSPSAGFTRDDHTFLKGMEEEIWDSSGQPPEGAYGGYLGGGGANGCFRIIDSATRHSVSGWEGTTPWPNRDDSALTGPLQPCTGDDWGIIVR